ncbi:protein ORF109 [Cyprinid herpesvirus 3]|nr:protein ORF109 [Cyprinid herpesvirus 3]
MPPRQSRTTVAKTCLKQVSRRTRYTREARNSSRLTVPSVDVPSFESVLWAQLAGECLIGARRSRLRREREAKLVARAEAAATEAESDAVLGGTMPPLIITPKERRRLLVDADLPPRKRLSIFRTCVKTERHMLTRSGEHPLATAAYLEGLPRNVVMAYLMFGTGKVQKLCEAIFTPYELARIIDAILSFPLEWSPLWLGDQDGEPDWFKRTIDNPSVDFENMTFEEAFEVAAETRRYLSRFQCDEPLYRPVVEQLEAARLEDLMQHKFKRNFGDMAMRRYAAGWGCYIYKSDNPAFSTNLRPLVSSDAPSNTFM